VAVSVASFAHTRDAVGQDRSKKATPPTTFRSAKKLMRRLYEHHPITFYCGCKYEDRVVNLSSCGYVPRNPKSKRAARVEWEHIVPAEAFGRSFPEWRDGHPACRKNDRSPFRGRACARAASAVFRAMEANPYNLVPAIGELNGLRSNFSMAMIPGEARRFGACDVEIEQRKFEPADAIKGDVARTYSYMHLTYPGRGIVSAKNERLFRAWAASDPVDAVECDRYERIREATGLDNPLLRAPCARLGSGARRGRGSGPISGEMQP